PIPQAGMLYAAEHCIGSQLKARDGFVTAEYAGTGFLMIKRAVIERLIAAHPELRYTGVHDDQPSAPAKPHYALFDCIIDPISGIYLSEDYSFCRRWRKLGGEIWIDTESRLTHIGPHAFQGDAKSRYGALISAGK